jgi:acetyltransferase-like isoleucine patch superfamily enzyme
MGCPHATVLRTLASNAELVLEAGVGVSGSTLCAARSIRIGEGTLIGAGAMILDNDFHQRTESGEWAADCETRARPVCIGRFAFVGARAVILKGVTIGDGAVIGAGAVVTKDVPAQHVAVGNPATVRPAPGVGSGDAS